MLYNKKWTKSISLVGLHMRKAAFKVFATYILILKFARIILNYCMIMCNQIISTLSYND